MKRFVRMNHKDTVATALDDFKAGDLAQVYSEENEHILDCRCIDDIPFGNKIALVDIEEGENVIKYGAVIGECTRGIGKGGLVHVHNVKSLVVDIPETFKKEIMRQMNIDQVGGEIHEIHGI
ncbi:altronate dehydratase small subunit [Dethiosulfatibacter aminovorans DSM 17477]|uniref:Altronate dehydratase small subunit n=1 Tax=Dethiosulfatibacter aminovorans DSM 17477 TaxID=1121476 RepID=A0A1M6JDI4_9FIRM|nr:UxaA family hydrolase [Dethiosulfatibacter aminovorans]SHJ44700.1 altronate dehydratase small subunit [Dethiosulfatibacter aminovorans DSM 17477]